MRIDPKSPICGISPAKLKALCRLRVITPQRVGKIVEINVAQAAALIERLVAEGWLRPISGERFESTEFGPRLVATPLIKPFSATVGEEIIRRTISAACEINADKSLAYVVTQLAVFGSMLEATGEQEVGDVDLAFELSPRFRDPARFAAALEAAQRRAPNSARGLDVLFWPCREVERRLAKAGRPRLSLADMETVTRLKFRHQVVLTFDRAGNETWVADRYVPADPK